MLSDNIPTDRFLEILAELEEINRRIYRLHAFAELSFAADTQDQAAQTFLAQILQTIAEIENRILFFSLWWKSLEETVPARLMGSSGDYSYWLEEMRHFKPHTLTEPEEKVINIKDVTGARAIINLYIQSPTAICSAWMWMGR